ncbi:hemolysin secretion protein D [Allostella sp. ATCC 35155]|nr:hemolysin secretion protein D [Stella sp. ATCC 35155]
MPEGGNVELGRADPMAAARARRRRLRRLFLMVVVPSLAAAGAFALYLNGGRYVVTDNAYIRADKVTVSTDISGVVTAVLVAENDAVVPGQPLFRFDAEPFELAEAAARANLGAVLAEIRTMQANYRQKVEEIRLADADAAYQEREFQRQSELGRRGVAAASVLDQARIAYARARQRAAAVREEAAAVLASLGGSPAADPAGHPRALQARAQLDRTLRERRRTLVTAPAAGIVVSVGALQPGEYLEAGKPAFTLVRTDHLWVDASPKETDLTHVALGNPATVTVDTYPGRTWTARVESLSPASGAEFAILPPQNASGNWIKVVQRIPMRVVVEPQPDGPVLRSGMSAVVTVDTGRERTLASVWSDLRRWLGIGAAAGPATGRPG